MVAGNTPELRVRVKAIDANLLAMRRLATLYADPEHTHVRTTQTDQTALRILQYHASELWNHVQAEPELASRFERSACVLLYRLALGHHVHLHVCSQDSFASTGGTEPRTQKQFLYEPGTTGQSGVPRAPLATHPYQRPAEKHERETSDDFYDIPAPISASLSALQYDLNDELSELLGSVSIADLVPGSLDDVCAQLSEMSPLASTPGVSDQSEDPDSYTTFLASVPLRSPSTLASSGGVRTHSSRSLRMNPLGRPGRQRSLPDAGA